MLEKEIRHLRGILRGAPVEGGFAGHRTGVRIGAFFQEKAGHFGLIEVGGEVEGSDSSRIAGARIGPMGKEQANGLHVAR
jgi:hypothetical protein